MHLTLLTPILLAISTNTLAAPTNSPPQPELAARQAPAKPAPCVRQMPAPSANETEARHNLFARAFIYDKNITRAFEFIARDYINHNPAAKNGSDSAWNILSPIWGSQQITPLRTTFKSPQGWLNYRTASFGEVVDRYRWEGGCIVEHWDQGERFPTTSHRKARE